MVQPLAPVFSRTGALPPARQQGVPKYMGFRLQLEKA